MAGRLGRGRRRSAWVCADGARDLTHEVKSMKLCHAIGVPTLF
jgi:hypothetical protein